MRSVPESTKNGASGRSVTMDLYVYIYHYIYMCIYIHTHIHYITLHYITLHDIKRERERVRERARKKKTYIHMYIIIYLYIHISIHISIAHLAANRHAPRLFIFFRLQHAEALPQLCNLHLARILAPQH